MSSDVDEARAERMRRLRDEAGLSQEALAREMGVSTKTVQRAEKASDAFGSDAWDAYSKRFKRSTDWIRFGDLPPTLREIELDPGMNGEPSYAAFQELKQTKAWRDASDDAKESVRIHRWRGKTPSLLTYLTLLAAHDVGTEPDPDGAYEKGRAAGLRPVKGKRRK